MGIRSYFSRGAWLGLCAFLCACTAPQAPSPAAVDLFADGARGFHRLAWVAARPLAEKNPWRFDEKARTLRVDGKGVHELLLYAAPLENGTLTVQFRFLPAEGAAEKGNSGVMLRTRPDRSQWLQAQMASKSVGLLFGDRLTNGKPERFTAGARDPSLFKPVGEWNDVRVVLRGAHVSLFINGRPAAHLDDAPQGGLLGFEAEFWAVEFRDARFTPAQETAR